VRKRSTPGESTPPASLGTLGDMLERQGIRSAPTAPPPPPAPAAPRDPGLPDLGRCGKLVVRRERKGHGGKTATIVAGIGLPARDLERLARALRHALGCGAAVDGDRLVVQGDQAPRVQAWLAAQGARRIVMGN
jgi:translation initiation factor 1